jgi:hypothetical protein
MTLREEYESGCTLACLEIRHKMNQRAIMRELELQGATMRPRSYPRDWNSDNNARIEELAAQGMKRVAIAALIGCSAQHVSRHLVKKGMRVR